MPELVPGLVFNTRSRPRSEWLIVLEWSWGGVASQCLGEGLAAFWSESWGGLRAVFGRLGAVLGRLGAVLERLGAVLERLGVILGRLGTILKRPVTSWDVLGSSWSRFVAILEPSWGYLGATLGRPWVVLGLFWAVLGCS